MRPIVLTHRRAGLAKRRPRLTVPSLLGKRPGAAAPQPSSPPRHQRKQCQPAGCGAGQRRLRPWPLGFAPERSADCLERALDGPAPHQPTHDGQRALGEIRTQPGWGIEALSRVADQHPANRPGGPAGVMPKRGTGANFDDAIAFAVPARHQQALPARAFTRSNRAPGGPPLSLLARATVRAGSADGSRVLARRRPTPAGHDGDARSHQSRPPGQGGKRAVAPPRAFEGAANAGPARPSAGPKRARAYGVSGVSAYTAHSAPDRSERGKPRCGPPTAPGRTAANSPHAKRWL
jgi:hypothetical protein